MSEGKWYVVYLDENIIDSPPFDTEQEAEDFMKNNTDYLESNGDTADSYQVQFIRDDEISDVEL